MKRIVLLLTSTLLLFSCQKEEFIPDVSLRLSKNVKSPKFKQEITDIEGNIYKTVKIGNQNWMAENLKTTHYNDGTIIPNISDDEAWIALTTGGYCDYKNDPAHSAVYGRLYNWFVVDNNEETKTASNGGRNVCPTGWHVPSDVEWTVLIDYLGGENVAGGKMKEVGLDHWSSPNLDATNSSGFTGLPGSLRGGNATFDFGYGGLGFWWSTTVPDVYNPWTRLLFYADALAKRYPMQNTHGLSVRCIKD